MSDDERSHGAISLPDGAVIRGRGIQDPLPSGPRPHFGLYLGVDYHPSWDCIRVAWPNYLLPRNFQSTARIITLAHTRALALQRVEIACNAGRGRTGTALACTAVLAGLPAADAIAWVRNHYEHRALRAPWQRWWVHWFAHATNRKR